MKSINRPVPSKPPGSAPEAAAGKTPKPAKKRTFAGKGPIKKPEKAKNEGTLKAPAKPSAQAPPKPAQSKSAKPAQEKTKPAEKPAPVKPASKPAEKPAPRGRPVDYHKEVPTVRVDQIFAPAAVEKPLTVSRIAAASRRSMVKPQPAGDGKTAPAKKDSGPPEVEIGSKRKKGK